MVYKLMKIKKISYFIFAALAASMLSAEINLPRIFSDDMLIQRQKPVKIWGTADANAAVEVEFAGEKKSAKAGNDGKWSVLLDPLEASREGRDMKFYENGKLSRTIKDVLVGEVWVLGGQSNMEMTYTWRNLKPEGNPDIRYFSNSAPSISETPQSDTTAGSQWKKADAKNAQSFSMVGYAFAQKLSKDLGVPVGLVYTARGGTRMETWIPFDAMDKSKYLKSRRAEYFEKLPEWKNGGYEKAAKAHKERMEQHKKAVAKAKAENKRPPTMPWKDKIAPRPQTPIVDLSAPAMHWNGKVAPLAGYTARGFLWYQGESNQNDSEALFVRQFRILVDAWRAAWGDNSMPWISVELASYGYGKDWGKVRAAQVLAAGSVDNSYIVCASDTGEKTDIHPADKGPISERLEKVAMRRVYDDSSVEDRSPVFAGATFNTGNAVVKFGAFSGKLVGKGEPRGFELKIDGKWIPAKSEIDSDSTVVVSAPNSHSIPEGVRYLWKSWAKPDAWLYTDGGLPAFGFEKENK